jgi:membrane associated rhomboid family serine protease
MGLHDRDYTQSEFRQQRFGLPQVRFTLPRPTTAVKWLLIVNFAVFLLSRIGPVAELAGRWFVVDSRSWRLVFQGWRLISYQFLHADLWHIFMNMLVLYMLGPSLERSWGTRKFTTFYLACGASGGLVYLLLARIGFLSLGTMLGASGAVYGLMAACAILVPHFVGVLFIFPVPIRVMVAVFAVASFLTVVTRDGNAGGEAAHLAGLLAGGGYVLLSPRLDRFTLKVRAGSWEKKLEDGRKLQIEVDRILAKVHREGLHSLTGAEKRTLKRATQEEIKRHKL